MCVITAVDYARFRCDEGSVPCVDFILKPLRAIAVDPAQRDEAGYCIEAFSPDIRHRVFITKPGTTEEWRLRKLLKFLLEDLGILAMTVRETIEGSVGKQVMATLAHRSSKDGKSVFQTVTKTARVIQEKVGDHQ
jgi:hypothetical protein